MDVSNLLKWDSNNDVSKSKKSSKLPNSNSTLSIFQDNISNFFGNTSEEQIIREQPTSTSSNCSTSSKDKTKGDFNERPISQTTLSSRPKSQGYMTNQLIDTLVEKFFAMALPIGSVIDSETIEGRIQAGKDRPPFSIPIMSNNFIRLNSRLSVPFEFIDNVIYFFNWKNPSLTITLLLIYTNIILKPIPTLLSFPFFFLLTYIMTPSFEARHEPDHYTVLGKSNPVLAEGPELKNVKLPKPAPEISKEFILNLTDLQNHMLLYVDAWDYTVDLLSKFAYFIDESVSGFYFLIFFTIGCLTLYCGDYLMQFIPVKFLLVIFGWAITISYHPYCYDYIFNLVYSEETRLFFVKKNNKLEHFIHKNFELIEPQEQKEVEVYEIHQYNETSKEWNLVFFYNDEFSKFSHERIMYNSETPIGASSLKRVKPPMAWEFVQGDDWKIDLEPKRWVDSEFLTDFVLIDDETKWVYDIEEPNETRFRRRRWIRIATRQSEIHMIDEQDDSTESVPPEESHLPIKKSPVVVDYTPAQL